MTAQVLTLVRAALMAIPFVGSTQRDSEELIFVGQFSGTPEARTRVKTNISG